MEVSAVRRAVFKVRALSLTNSKGSNRALCRASGTKERSREFGVASEDLTSLSL